MLCLVEKHPVIQRESACVDKKHALPAVRMTNNVPCVAHRHEH